MESTIKSSELIQWHINALKNGAEDVISIQEAGTTKSITVELLETAKKELKAFEIIKEHPLLDLGNLADYDDNLFEDYWENEQGTTNELTEEEFKTLKEVIKI